MARRAAVLVAVLAMMLTTVMALPAQAGFAARNCTTFYHHNDRSTGWGFTICVKLEHDAWLHQWSTHASVSTTTPGMVLHLGLVRVWIADQPLFAGGGGSGVGFIASDPEFWRCRGTERFAGDARARVTWPNGVLSDWARGWTDDPESGDPRDHTIVGNC